MRAPDRSQADRSFARHEASEEPSQARTRRERHFHYECEEPVKGRFPPATHQGNFSDQNWGISVIAVTRTASGGWLGAARPEDAGQGPTSPPPA